MTKLVAIKAEFKNMEAYLAQAPSSVEFSYFDGGKLTAKDRSKVDAITLYLLHNGLWPIFIIQDKQASPLIAEATLDLSEWTREGLPIRALRDMQGKRFETPNFLSPRAKSEV